MQEFKHEKMIATKAGKTVQELIEEMNPDTTHATIGTLPTRGELVKINGLIFMVLSASPKKGTLHLELLKPEKYHG